MVKNKNNRVDQLEKKSVKNIPLYSGSIIALALIIIATIIYTGNHNQKTPAPVKKPVIIKNTKSNNATPNNQTTQTSGAPQTTASIPAPKKQVAITQNSQSEATSSNSQTPTPDPIISPQIINTNRTVLADLTGLTLVNVAGVYDAGYGFQGPIPGVVDDGFIHIPMSGNNFNFFGTNYGSADTISWNSNNALVFGAGFDPHIVSISHNSAPALLLGNYDRLSSAVYYSHSTTTDNKFNITKILVKFANYYTDSTNLDAGIYQIRLIKEVSGDKRQWIEVSIISSPSSPGYSNNPLVSYPSGINGNGNPVDSDGYVIDSTKNSPYNITDGTTFLNPLGSLYSLASPPSGTSFILQSDELGNNWSFTNNSYLNL